MAGPKPQTFDVQNVNLLQKLDDRGAKFEEMGLSPVAQSNTPSSPSPSPALPGLGV